MKPLLARSLSSPHSSSTVNSHHHQNQNQNQNIIKKSSLSFRPIGPIVTPYHLIHYPHQGSSVNSKQNNNNNYNNNNSSGVNELDRSEFASSSSSGPGPGQVSSAGSGAGGGGTSHSHGFVAGWLARRGSVPDHNSSRQGASLQLQSHDATAAGVGLGQSRPAVGNRKGSVVTQQDEKQRSAQLLLDGRRAATNNVAAGATAVTSNVNATATLSTVIATSKSELVKTRRFKAAMEEISQSIHRLESSAGQQVIQLTDTYESVIGKLEELQVMTTRFAELQKMTTDLVDNFTTKEEEFVMDMESHIKTVGEYQEEVSAIRVLQRRLDLQRKAVENYKTRLETVEERISRQKELEVVWRQRASRRLRIVWGIISVLVIVWLLATSTHDNYLIGIDEVDEGDEQSPEQQFMEDALGVKFEYGSLPKEVLSLEAERLLRERHQHDEP